MNSQVVFAKYLWNLVNFYCKKANARYNTKYGGIEMTVEEQIKNMIIEKFKSVRAFTQFINVPYSTIDTMIKRGISGTAITTVLKVCRALNIDAESLETGIIALKSPTTTEPLTINQSPTALDEKISRLDEVDLAKTEAYVDGLLSSAKYEIAAAEHNTYLTLIPL